MVDQLGQRDRIEEAAPTPGGGDPEGDQADEDQPAGIVPDPGHSPGSADCADARGVDAALSAAAASSSSFGRDARRRSHKTPKRSLIPTRSRSKTPYFEMPRCRGR